LSEIIVAWRGVVNSEGQIIVSSITQRIMSGSESGIHFCWGAPRVLGADLGVGPGKSDNYRLTDPWVSTHTNLAGYIPTRAFFFLGIGFLPRFLAVFLA